jgi:hypothetical protein
MKPQGIFSLADALVSNTTFIKERDNSFSIQSNPHLSSKSKTIFLSSNNLETSNEWRDAIISAS